MSVRRLAPKILSTSSWCMIIRVQSRVKGHRHGILARGGVPFR